MTRDRAVNRILYGIVRRTMEAGQQPLRVLLSVADYRALVAKRGLEPRSIGKTKKDTLRVKLLGFDLPADADKRVDDLDPMVMGYVRELAHA